MTGVSKNPDAWKSTTKGFGFLILVVAFYSVEVFAFPIKSNKKFGTVTNSPWSADIELMPDGRFVLISVLWQDNYNSVTRTTSKGRYTIKNDLLILKRGRKAQAFRYVRKLNMRELGANKNTEGIVSIRPFVWGREFENLKLWKVEDRDRVLYPPKKK